MSTVSNALKPSRKSKRLVFGVLGLLLSALLVIIVISLSWLKQDRADLAARFSKDRLIALTDVAGEVEGEIQDIAEDLLLTARLITTVATPETRYPLLETVLSVGKAYQAFIIFGPKGEPDLFLTDPRRGGPLQETVLPIARKTATNALREKGDSIKVSPLFRYSNRAIRVFTIKLPAALPGGAVGALTLVVDMEQYISRFKIAASDEHTHLVILGPHGEPLSLSSPAIAGVLNRGIPLETKELPTFYEVVHKMRAGDTGTMRIADQEAKHLGLGSADVIAAYAPVRLDGAHHWSAATFTSMAALKAHEWAVIARLSTVSLAVALMLVLLSIYVVMTSRNRALLQERVRHLDEVARLNEKAKKILDAIPIDVVVVSDDGRITDRNRAFSTREVQRTAERISDLFASSGDEGADVLNALMRDALAEEVPKSIVGERMALMGQDGFYGVHAVPLAPRSPDASLLLVIEDLSEVKRLESKLLATEKLATAGVLAAGIAHEIGTPLGVVRGRAEYMLGKLSPDSPLTSGLTTIVEQIDRVVRTIRHLLDYSRPRPQPVTVVAVDVSELLDRCGALLKFEASRRKMSLTIMTSPGLPLAAADPDQLEQVLVNLIMNAFDAGNPGGEVTVSATVSVKDENTKKAEHALQIAVMDNGCGIPKENAQRIFDPFFTTKKLGKSTGLGLTMVSQIVRSHDAQIQVSSKEGKGTKVILYWPAVAAEAQS
jgi:two-component system sensor histidine kinase HydH